MPEPNETQQIEKIIFEFQHTDENGNPLIDPRTGKPGFTNLTGANYQEIAEKLRDSYLNANRALARRMNHKPVPKPEQPKPPELSAEEERQAAADLQDPSKARAAVRKLTGADDLEARQRATDEAQYKADSSKAAYQFMSEHLSDYYPCQANSAAMSKYITDNELDPRVVENYEVAFIECLNAGKLAPRPAPPAAKVEEPEPPPPPPRRASGGIEPGSLSGQRPPKRKPNEVTKESVLEMQKTPEGRAEYKKRLRDPRFVEQVNALGVRPRGNFF
jgi:hypothetical protein